MPPTHPSQADVAAAYRTLIAHETEPNEQDFYRTRLQRLEQATESVCELDCRNRVAAVGVGVYCPKCSAKCADTDLATQLAKAIRAAWVDRLDWDELAHAALKFLTAAGRLVPAGGMALTAEQVEDVRTAREELRGHRNFTGYGRSHVNQLIAAVDAPFPATEPAEEVLDIGSADAEQVSGNLSEIPVSSPTVDEGRESGGQMDRYTCIPAPAEPAEEETKAEEHRSVIHSNRTIKTVGEALSYAETALFNAYPDSGQRAHYAEVIAELLRDVARQRPVCSNGKHGKLHTPTCGCEDVTFSAPVVEEETKAETADAMQRRFIAEIRSMNPDAVMSKRLDDLEAELNASSPVVPAPTETEWQTWQEVPEGRTVQAKNRHTYTKRDGILCIGTSTMKSCMATSTHHLAPFVAAEEG